MWAEPVDPLLYSWMVDGAAPPPYVSVWVSRQGDSADVEPGNDLDVDRIMLPWFERDGTTYRSRVGLLGVRELLVTLLVHPGWNTTHPLEGTGQAFRIYPSTGALAMTDLVDCDSRGRKGWGSVFAGAVRLMLADDCDPLSHP